MSPSARRRRRRKAAAAARAVADAALETVAPEVVERPELARTGEEPEAAPPASRRRRRRRGSGSGAAADEPTAEEAAAVAEVTEADQAAEGAPAPARRRRRRKSNGAAPTEAEAAAAVGAPQLVVAPDAEAGEGGEPSDGGERKRGRRSRRGRPERQPIPTALPRTMLITVRPDRTQIAVLEESELVELYVASPEDRSIVGNVYLGRVQNVLPGMEAAFINIGEERNAVIYVGEVSFDEDVEGVSRRIEKVLKSGQPILAQVTKDPIGSKGARLSSEISLAGRYVVLVPEEESLGVSRRLPDEERARLREIAQRLRPEGYGLIVRTAARGAAESDLEVDIQRLVASWEQISAKAKGAQAPALIHAEPELALRVIRDLLTEDVERVVTDSAEVYDQIHSYVGDVTPALLERLDLYEATTPLFRTYNVYDQLRRGLDRKVNLPSGGHLVIDRTEAMTVIDVNTGRYVGRSTLEDTVLKTNLEAAVEVAKQLRLRDIGGIIVVDFIDMLLIRHREELVREFKAALARDKTRTQVFDVSELGLVQMTRKRISEGLLEAFSEPCDKCGGRGVLLMDVEAEIPAAVQ